VCCQRAAAGGIEEFQAGRPFDSDLCKSAKRELCNLDAGAIRALSTSFKTYAKSRAPESTYQCVCG
jgi:hypothetical protein